MSVAVAEQLPKIENADRFFPSFHVTQGIQHDQNEHEMLGVLVVPELKSDEFARKRAERIIRSVGGYAVETVSTSKAGENGSLYEALQSASLGGQEAKKMLRVNATTDLFERMVKAGFVISVDLGQNERGQIVQHGQTAEQIQSNSLAYGSKNAKMQQRYKAEVNNAMRMEQANREGLLDTHAFVVFSQCPDDMSNEEIENEQFFVHTKSMSVQVTTKHGDKLQTESAFVAGVHTKDAERHDGHMVEHVAKRWGVRLPVGATELLDTPLLVPKEMIQNGVVDIVQILDEATGTFFGLDEPRQDYRAFRQECKKREEAMATKVEEVVETMIRRAPTIKNAVEASQLLNKISAQVALEHAVEDKRIDARVFGTEAAWLVQDARAHYALGEIHRVAQVTQRALRVETSSSCPGGVRSSQPGQEYDALGENGEDESKTDTPEDCDFISKECPKCGAKNVKTSCRNGKYYGECGCHS